MDCLLLPKLQSLSLRFLTLPHLPAPDHWNGKASTLKKLSIEHYKSDVYIDALQHIFRMCPHLQHFKFHGGLGLNRVDAGVGMPGVDFALRPEYELSIKGIQNALDHVRTTLQVLDLRIPLQDLVEYAGGPINLSSFHALKRLRIPSLFLLKMKPYPDIQPNKTKLYRRIPPNIQSLHIDFLPCTGIAGNFSAEPNFSSQPVSTLHVPRERLEWVLQFPLHKPTSFPFLTQLHLEDDEFFWQPHLWEPMLECPLPDDMRSRSEDAGIEVLLKVLWHAL